MRSPLPLLVEWSPGAVRLVDPATGHEAQGASITECEPTRGRDVVVAVGRRSAFIRTVPVPLASRAEVARVVEFALMAALPLEPKETVFGFRIGQGGRTAIVGAMRAESLERLYAEVHSAGVRVRAVLPVAFGAWRAARERGKTRCAVAELYGGILNVDIIDGGELVYSRSVPSTFVEDAQDEIARTFATADVAPSAILALASPELVADDYEPREALLQLADLRALRRQLFTFELPARREARLAKARRWRVQRALLAIGLALATSAYAYKERVLGTKVSSPPESLASSVRKAQRERSALAVRGAATDRENRILDVAFRPAQGMADVVAALANVTPPDAWVTSISVVRGAPATVSGYALAGKDVARFFRNIAHNPRFSRSQVVSTSVASIGKTPVVQFVISGDAVGTAPFDRPLRRKPKVVKAPSAIR